MNQIQEFIKEVLQGLWPDWEPTDMEMVLWSEKLQKCDYSATKKAMCDWHIKQERLGRRPVIAKMKSLFMRKIDAQQERDNEPVLLYILVKEHLFEKGLRKGLNFSANKRSAIPKDSNIIEEQAERMREKANQMYGCNHIILRHWEKEFEPAPF